MKELHSTQTPRHRPDNGSCERALQNELSWAPLEWSLQWLDFWIIRQTARVVTSTVYGAEANTDKFDSHASVSAKTLVTRSLANWAIRAMETVSALPRSQAVREVGRAQPSWDAPEGRALSSQTSDNGKTSPSLGLCSLYSCISKSLPKNVWAELHKNQAKESPTKAALNIWEFLKLLQKV